MYSTKWPMWIGPLAVGQSRGHQNPTSHEFSVTQCRRHGQPGRSGKRAIVAPLGLRAELARAAVSRLGFGLYAPTGRPCQQDPSGRARFQFSGEKVRIFPTAAHDSHNIAIVRISKTGNDAAASDPGCYQTRTFHHRCGGPAGPHPTPHQRTTDPAVVSIAEGFRGIRVRTRLTAHVWASSATRQRQQGGCRTRHQTRRSTGRTRLGPRHNVWPAKPSARFPPASSRANGQPTVDQDGRRRNSKEGPMISTHLATLVLAVAGAGNEPVLLGFLCRLVRPLPARWNRSSRN